MNKTPDCCERELTIQEEIMRLEIDGALKERLIGKLDRLVKDYYSQNEYIYNCHEEIDRLNRAIVEQAKLIGRFAEEKINNEIRR